MENNNEMIKSVVSADGDINFEGLKVNNIKMLQLEHSPIEQAEADLKAAEEIDLTKEENVNETTEALENAISADQLAQLRSMMFRRPPQQVRKYEKIGRNDECPCGSGKKYKNCCLKTGKYEGLEYKKRK